MIISYNWLKNYLLHDLTPSEVADALTSIGLESSGVEEVETIKGGLKGLVIGEVLTCEDHPNSDHLHLTKVNIGAGEPLKIVCGAPNVCAGMKVVVATIGTILYDGDKSFKIKPSKIRGEESYGMLCSETEIGVGKGSDGIIDLSATNAIVGQSAAEFYGVESDYIMEVDITPNRVDATSHFGVARDLAAYITEQKDLSTPLRAILPEVKSLNEIAENKSSSIEVEILTSEDLVRRFQGLEITNVRVEESPKWLKDRLQTIGLNPINNVVDITNYVLHEFGQPLHAYDLNKIEGGKLVINYGKSDSKFVALDKEEHPLSSDDIVIFDGKGNVRCVAGVIGALEGSTTEETTSIFLEAANFHPTFVRKTARRVGVSTDSSFRFERGLDPNNTSWALARAANLIAELTGGEITRKMIDIYPKHFHPYRVDLHLERMNQIVGQIIPIDHVRRILESLSIEVVNEKIDEVGGLTLKLDIPVYRFDVNREIDVIEDILRIYGYNKIQTKESFPASISQPQETDFTNYLQRIISEQLVGEGCHEILTNSLSSESYYSENRSYPKANAVELMNPLSRDLALMRQTLLYGGLEAIARNINRQIKRFYLYEWGNCYSINPAKYQERTEEYPLKGIKEDKRLGIWVAGLRHYGSWMTKDEATSPYDLTAIVDHVFVRLGIVVSSKNKLNDYQDIYVNVIEYVGRGGQRLATVGIVNPKVIKSFDFNTPVYFAELSWDAIMKAYPKETFVAKSPSKFQEVKRDIALLLDKSISFQEIRRLVEKTEKKYLSHIELFDVYEGEKLQEGKKSYAFSIYLHDEEKTMSDKQIDAIIKKITNTLLSELHAEQR